MSDTSENPEWTLEKLEKELVNAVIAKSNIDDLIEAIKAARNGRFNNIGSSDYKTGPYGTINEIGD